MLTDLSFLAPPHQVADWRLVVTFGAAVESGLLDALPGTADDLARRLELHPHSVRALLDALGDWDVVRREEGGRYVVGAEAPSGDDAVTLWHHARAVKGWTRLGDALREPVAAAQGAPASPDRFQAALAVGARRRAVALVDAILRHVGDVHTMLDLGGGHGEYALEFSRRGIAAVMQDREQMIDAARRRGAVAGHVELFTGDFFEVLPQRRFGLVLIAGVTHTMDAERNQALLRRVRTVLAPGGTVAIVTMLQRRHAIATLFAVQMLVNGGGGDTHAEADYRGWLADAGYVDVEVFDIPETETQSAILGRVKG